MKRAAPWSIDGIKPDIREAAREAARRQGLTLSEWLNDIIVEQASDLDVDVEELDSDERLEAVTARLHQLDGRDSRYERPLRARAASRGIDYDDDFAPRVTRNTSPLRDDLEERRRLKRQNRQYERAPDVSSDHLRRHDAEDLLDAAIEAFDERASKSQRQTAQSVDAVTRLLKSQTRRRDDSLEVLSNISDRLADIETQMTRQAVDEACGHGDRNKDLEVLPVLARRLEDIESHLSKRAQVDTYRPIKGVLTRLEARLDALHEKSMSPPPPAPAPRDEMGLKRLESKLDALLRSSTLSANTDIPVQRHAPKADWRDSLESAIAEIGHKQRLLNSDTPDWRRSPARQAAEGSLINARINRPRVEPTPARAPDIHPLQNEIAALGAKLEAMRVQDLAKDLNRLQTQMGTMSAGLADLAPRDAVTSIESAIRNLTTRIEASREDGGHGTLLQPLAELAKDLRHSLDNISPQPSMDGVEREIKTLGERLESIGQSPHDPDALARIQEQTQEIHKLLTIAASHPMPIEQIERKIASLAEQIERQRSFAHPVLGPSEEDFVSPQLHEAQVESLAKIEDRLNDLSLKMERAISAPPTASAKVDTAALEAVVNGLAAKFAAAQEPGAGGGAFEALQGQIAELAQRLEHSDAGYSTLKSLQSSVSDLFSHLEETRYAASEAAVTSARNAAREAIREVMEQPGLLAGNAALDSGITREIADLRLVQDEADQRTHSTLNAVHATLEKIVERLAMLEEDIGAVQEASAMGIRLAEQNAQQDRYRDHAPAVAQSDNSAGRQNARQPRLSDEAARMRASASDPGDFLIEPGTLFPKSKEPLVPRDTELDLDDRLDGKVRAEPTRNRADFIAAARRAAQAAQAEQGQREIARPRIPMAETQDKANRDKASQASLVAQTREFLSTHKRQLTLSIAALFLAVGAYAVAKTMSHTNVDAAMTASPKTAIHGMADMQPDRKADRRAPETVAIDSAPASPVASAMQPKAPQESPMPAASVAPVKPDLPGARSEMAPSNLPMMATGGRMPQKAITGSDPIVTGSIVPPKNGVAPAAVEPAAALAALRSQAEAGNENAQYDLAGRYAEGRSMARDFKLAADWYEKAAAKGLAPAAYRLGSLYEKGLGVNRDLPRAKLLYQKAADLGNSHAMHNLAVLVAEGGDGKPDYSTAATWFRKAAELGIRDSQYNLAILYARGLGVQQDLIQSYKWFAIAAAQGDEDAGKKSQDVAAKLDAKSLGQAKELVERFRPQQPDSAANEVQVPPGGWEAATPVQISPKISSVRPKISRL